VKYRLSVLALLLYIPLSTLHAQPADYPVFVAQVPNPNDYMLFANAGWDGNWYVGYNSCWIKKLPPVPPGHFAHAYLGAKLGRMKTLPSVGRPPVFDPIPGEIWAAIASTPSWKSGQGARLVSTDDIPLEASSEYALENVGESEWFWTEVPLSSVNLSGDNYVALWSPTRALVSVSSAPVLAAAWGGKEINTWLAKDVKGEPPADPKAALSSGISYFQPAIALKLIPEGGPHLLQVRLVSWQNGTPDHLKPVITASVTGESVDRAWIEANVRVRHGDVVRGGWQPVGRPLWKAPFVFTLEQGKLPTGKVQLRIAASNIWHETAYSDVFAIEVKPIAKK